MSGDIGARTPGAGFGALQTFSFLRMVAPIGASILDVGCGNGLLAKYLQDAGYKVVAIDTKQQAVDDSKALGLNAVEADLLQYACDSKFDLVLLSRTLHHIQPLGTALDQARELMRDDGLLVVEDFGAELADRHTAAWLFGLRALLAARGPLKSRGPALEDGEIPEDPLQSWNEHAFVKHQITPSETMIRELTERFDILKLERIAYLYRYFLDDVSMLEAVRIFEWEQLLCKERLFEPIGIRIVAKKRAR
ncbi:MAG TPA: class I SAM-dependent methyltransferase [Planktothrix sp.]|jgi:SAM-dependent methyltransferase